MEHIINPQNFGGKENISISTSFSTIALSKGHIFSYAFVILDITIFIFTAS